MSIGSDSTIEKMLCCSLFERRAVKGICAPRLCVYLSVARIELECDKRKSEEY